MQETIVNFAPTGTRLSQRDTSHVPLEINAIIDEVHRAAQIGISMVHLHARQPHSGEPAYEADIYAEIIEGIRREAPELVICVSLSGRRFKTFEQRAEVLKLDGALKPDMGSLTLGSMNFTQEESVNAPQMIQRLAETMKAKGILPELEMFDLGMVNYANYLIKKGVLDAPVYCNLLFGNIAGAQADLLHAAAMLRDLPENALWSFAGFAEQQLKMNAVAIALGGGVRVGLEDNIWFDARQTVPATNEALLMRVKALIDLHGRTVMPPSRLRERLRLQPGNGAYGRKVP